MALVTLGLVGCASNVQTYTGGGTARLVLESLDDGSSWTKVVPGLDESQLPRHTHPQAGALLYSWTLRTVTGKVGNYTADLYLGFGPLGDAEICGDPVRGVNATVSWDRTSQFATWDFDCSCWLLETTDYTDNVPEEEDVSGAFQTVVAFDCSEGQETYRMQVFWDLDPAVRVRERLGVVDGWGG